MHDLACQLRRFGNGPASASPALSAPDLTRADPFPALHADWQELISFDLTVNATTEEGVASRVIHGPFRIDEICLRSGSAGGSSQQLRVSVGDTFPAPAGVVGSDSGLPSQAVTDSSRSVGTFYATNVFERHALAVVENTGTTRLQFILNNTTGGAVTVVGQVLITHLRPVAPLLAHP